MADAAQHDSKQLTLTFPDGATRKVEAGTTGLSVAKAISPSLAKRTVAMSLDGNLSDLADPITKDAHTTHVAAQNGGDGADAEHHGKRARAEQP